MRQLRISETADAFIVALLNRRVFGLYDIIDILADANYSNIYNVYGK
jgi:hypothetical protein